MPSTGSALPDVAEDDVLVHGGTEYRVIYAAEWPGLTNNDIPCLQIVVDEIQGT